MTGIDPRYTNVCVPLSRAVALGLRDLFEISQPRLPRPVNGATGPRISSRVYDVFKRHARYHRRAHRRRFQSSDRGYAVMESRYDRVGAVGACVHLYAALFIAGTEFRTPRMLPALLIAFFKVDYRSRKPDAR